VTLFIIIGVLWIVVARPTILTSSAFPKNSSIVDPVALKNHVVKLSEDLAPRNYKHSENLDQVAEYIANSFRLSGAHVADQSFELQRVVFKNVIAEYGPQSREIIVIGAHYDAAGEHPGADDNASGVAGLLELGRLMANATLRSRVVLVAFTLEEPPFYDTEFMGSIIFAKALAENDVSVKLMINLEMIGYFTEVSDSQKFPAAVLRLFYPAKGNFVAIADQTFSMQAQRMKNWMNRVINVPVYSINAPSFVPGIDFSDHRNFWHFDYPAVVVSDTAFYRNQAYHTEGDTAERLNYEKMAQVVYGVFSYVLQLDQGT
jgi:Zn-dependent M28 family amino/carboxypeptidase